MQSKGKLVNQPYENGKKTNFGPNFGLFGQTLGPQNFIFAGFTSTTSKALFLAITVCNFKENYWTKFEEMAKPSFGPNFDPFGPQKILPLLEVIS